MNKYLLLLMTFSFSLTSIQAKVINVTAIGKSAKGQFVAIEEFGYQVGNTRPYSKIRLVNMWKDKYVSGPIHILGTEDDISLEKIRKKAFDQALIKFKKYGLNF
ncbi:MAG: hypothetical protein CME62_13845 [Halobacteriovoraceae bacterium]|nr:hypothetical protein [Halobacteriovoraceae bacterium]|tara:strand:+ start:3948 stop:4259 length:312 start_codon:yes stop_codon:yes gene_type:complete